MDLERKRGWDMHGSRLTQTERGEGRGRERRGGVRDEGGSACLPILFRPPLSLLVSPCVHHALLLSGQEDRESMRLRDRERERMRLGAAARRGQRPVPPLRSLTPPLSLSLSLSLARSPSLPLSPPSLSPSLALSVSVGALRIVFDVRRADGTRENLWVHRSHPLPLPIPLLSNRGGVMMMMMLTRRRVGG
eukprot:3434690-Rhodomonas_salina.1